MLSTGNRGTYTQLSMQLYLPATCCKFTFVMKSSAFIVCAPGCEPSHSRRALLTQHDRRTTQRVSVLHALLACRNKNSPALLRNIATAISTSPAAAAGGSGGSLWARDPAVVVLADTDKAVMDASVQEAVR
jgi:dihydroorotase-like cyclic amidohydrolase